MKARRVVLQIEVETDLPITMLRHARWVRGADWTADIAQCQANVVTGTASSRPRHKRRRR